MSTAAITVERVSKAYRIWDSPKARFKAPALAAIAQRLPRGHPLAARLLARAHRYFHEFYALRDISFEVARGEAIGIVGRNGSGKSTLLQIITGTLQPTVGRVAITGRVAALLELGSGFNPEFTGRENVRMNAAILGLTPREIDERFDRIAAFADIGEFLEQPVKTYSSGMYVRLAFAVQAHVNPEILIVDEALSVGDAQFQLKCFKFLDHFLEQGHTLLFVSHDLAAVKRLCSEAILLERGRALLRHAPNVVANIYSKMITDPRGADAVHEDIVEARKDRPAPDMEHLPAPHLPEPAALRTDQLFDALSEREFHYGGELGRITAFSMARAGVPAWSFTSGEAAQVVFEAEAYEAIAEPLFAVTIKNHQGLEMYGTNTRLLKYATPPMAARGRVRVVFDLQLQIMAGEYFLSLGFVTFVGGELYVIHRRYDCATFRVLPSDPGLGMVNCNGRVKVDHAG